MSDNENATGHGPAKDAPDGTPSRDPYAEAVDATGSVGAGNPYAAPTARTRPLSSWTTPSTYSAPSGASAAQAPGAVGGPTSTGGYGAAPQAAPGYDFSRPASYAPVRTEAPQAAGGAGGSHGGGSLGGGSHGGGGGGVPGPGLPPSAPAPRRERRRPGWVALMGATLASALVASGATVGAVTYLDRDSGHASSADGTAATALATGSTTQLVSSTGQAPDWEAVTTAVGNAVVSIAVATSAGTGEGSGVIYDSSGHIITNNHVVAGASKIQVTLADGRIYSATLTGTDPATDLAVIEIDDAPDDLTVATLGDSDKLVTGEDVMAIGNPLGLSSTATTGIISALNRPVVTTQEEESQDGSGSGGLGGLLGQQQATSTQVYTNAVQIDAAVNPGNSGGPLFDETGAVIGITSSIATMGASDSNQSGSIGIGFAIPVNLAKKVADQLIESGTATHAYLGVSIGDGSGSANGTRRAGAEVGEVESGSPAAAAGLRSGDVITAIDGKNVSQAAALTGFVRQYSSGDKVALTVIRDGKETTVDVTLAERTDS